MRKAAIISALLHVTVFLAAWFGLPELFRNKPMDEAVHVDVVMLEDQPKPAAKPEPPKPEPKPAPKPKPAAAAPRPSPPPEPPPVPEAPKLAEVTPEPPPEPTPAPQVKPKPEPKKVEPPPKPEAKAPPPKPKPTPKPKPKRKPKPPPDQFQTILKNLAKEKAAQEKTSEKQEKSKVAAADPSPRADRPAAQRNSIDAARESARLAAMVKQQVTPCWNIPGGAKDAQKMQIAVRIQLNPDGTLRGAPRIEDARRMSSDPFYRAMAESAARALRLPSCSPLKLPYDRYDLWKEITLVFDPSEALGP